MNQNQKNIITSVLVAFVVAVGAWVVLPKNVNLTAGQINSDIRRINSNTYTTFAASSTVSLALDNTAGCLGLEIQNTNGQPTRIKLQATSTGVTATSGLRLAAGQGYTPEFAWSGQVWTITESGTSTLEIQCSK